MINRRRPLVFRPVSPFKKGSKTSTAMFDAAGQCLGKHQESQRTDHALRLKFKVTSSAAGPRRDAKFSLSPGPKLSPSPRSLHCISELATDIPIEFRHAHVVSGLSLCPCVDIDGTSTENLFVAPASPTKQVARSECFKGQFRHCAADHGNAQTPATSRHSDSVFMPVLLFMAV